MKRKMNIIHKILLGTVMVALFAIAMAPSIASAKAYRLQDFMILVDDQLIIKGAADVTSYQGGIFQGVQMRSDLGSRNFLQIGGKLTTRIPLAAPTVTDVALIAPIVTLGNFSKVSHVIYDLATGSYNDIATVGRLGPTLLEDKICDNSLDDTGGSDCLPDFPSFPTFAPGATDVVVPSSGSTSITPGSYRDLIVGFRGKVDFAAGIYNFRRIIVNVAGTYSLNFEDDTEIRVKDFVRLAEYGDVNPTGAKNVIMYVEGTDGSYGNANRNQDGVDRTSSLILPPNSPVSPEPAAFEYDGDGHFELCFIFVPNGTMNLRGHSQPVWATQWLGNSLQEISSLRISLQQASESCVPGGIECACITDFKLISSSDPAKDGRLRVKGINFSEDTVGKLAIFTENASESINGLSGGDANADQAAAVLDFVSTDQFNTVNNVVEDLQDANSNYPSGAKFYLGIIYPTRPNPTPPPSVIVPGYCIFTDKVLELP
jgi:hypothetical protein